MARVVSKERSEIRLSERGHWFHRQEPFENENIIRFFHRAIRKDESGRYYLYNTFEGNEEKVYFEVEDTAFFVWRVKFDRGSGVFRITLNTGSEETLDVHSLHEDARGVMYCLLSDGDRARFNPRSLQQLSEHAVMDGDAIFIDVKGERIFLSGRGDTGGDRP